MAAKVKEKGREKNKGDQGNEKDVPVGGGGWSAIEEMVFLRSRKGIGVRCRQDAFKKLKTFEMWKRRLWIFFVFNFYSSLPESQFS